jgi:hypothetical protein
MDEVEYCQLGVELGKDGDRCMVCEFNEEKKKRSDTTMRDDGPFVLANQDGKDSDENVMSIRVSCSFFLDKKAMFSVFPSILAS